MYKDLIPLLLAVHALTAFDTAPKMFRTGKGKTLNIMKTITLQCHGEKDASKVDFMDVPKIFIAHSYGVTQVSSLSSGFGKNIQRFFLYFIQIKKFYITFSIVFMPKEKQSRLYN